MSIASIISQGSPQTSYLSLQNPSNQTSIKTDDVDHPATPSFGNNNNTKSVLDVAQPPCPSSQVEDLERQQRHHLQQFYYFQQLAIERYNKAQEQSLKEQKEIEDIFRQYSFGDQADTTVVQTGPLVVSNDKRDYSDRFDTLDPAAITKAAYNFPRESSASASSTSLARVPSLVASSPSSSGSGSEANLSFEDLVMQTAQAQPSQSQYTYGMHHLHNRPLPYPGSGHANPSSVSIGHQYAYAQAPDAYAQNVAVNGPSFQNAYPGQRPEMGPYQGHYNVGAPMQQTASHGMLSAEQLSGLAAVSSAGQYGRNGYITHSQNSSARTSLDMMAPLSVNGDHRISATQPTVGPYNTNGMYYRVENPPLGTARGPAGFPYGQIPDNVYKHVKQEAYSPGTRINSLTGSPIAEDAFSHANGQQAKLSGKVIKKGKKTTSEAPYSRRQSAVSQPASGESSIVTVVALNGPQAVEQDELPEDVRNPLGGGRGYVPGETPDDPTKKHHCGICGRGFARLYNLKSHAQTHDPERPKPHACPDATCKKSFSRLHDLERHRQGIHNDGPLVDAKRQGVTPAHARAQHRIHARAERGDLI